MALSLSTVSNPQFVKIGVNTFAPASLTIAGDLSTMCNDWSKDEMLAKRRLVEFSRSQAGSSITTTFKAVSLDERQPNNPCISCIYWEREAQYYVTGADIVALLEAIISVRFTKDEKDRIRRNLEAFKPYTVKDNDGEDEDIFKLIMGFPKPKPRNIAKSIKIFHWSILGEALKKVVSKYSTSDASTSAAIAPPANYYSSMAVSSLQAAYRTSLINPGLSQSLVAESAGLEIAGGGGLPQSLPSLSQQHEGLRLRQTYPSGVPLTHIPNWHAASYPFRDAPRDGWYMGSYQGLLIDKDDPRYVLQHSCYLG